MRFKFINVLIKLEGRSRESEVGSRESEGRSPKSGVEHTLLLNSDF